jgi:hypothetical protein
VLRRTAERLARPPRRASTARAFARVRVARRGARSVCHTSRRARRAPHRPLAFVPQGIMRAEGRAPGADEQGGIPAWSRAIPPCEPPLPRAWSLPLQCAPHPGSRASGEPTRPRARRIPRIWTTRVTFGQAAPSGILPEWHVQACLTGKWRFFFIRLDFQKTLCGTSRACRRWATRRPRKENFQPDCSRRACGTELMTHEQFIRLPVFRAGGGGTAALTPGSNQGNAAGEGNPEIQAMR